jgi:hypothetical protein
MRRSYWPQGGWPTALSLRIPTILMMI